MKKNRLENRWETPPPDFLHRVGIYHRTRSPTPYREITELPEDIATTSKRNRGCSACTPSPAKPPLTTEERIPWSPPRGRLSRRRSSSIAVQPLSDFDIPRRKKSPPKVKPPPSPDEPQSTLPALPTERVRSKSVNAAGKRMPSEPSAERRLVLTQGALKLCINFPPHAEVKIVSSTEDKYIQRGHCECKALAKFGSN